MIEVTKVKSKAVVKLGMQIQKAANPTGEENKVTVQDVIRVTLHTLMTSIRCSEEVGNEVVQSEADVYRMIASTANALADKTQRVDVELSAKEWRELNKPLDEKEEEQKAKKEEKFSMTKQWNDLKKKHPDALLLFRCGDFYESYKDDAEKAAKVLGITLTKHSKKNEENGKPLRMAGFPYHALDTYLPKLIRAGVRVAICDQIEAPKPQQKKRITELMESKKEA